MKKIYLFLLLLQIVTIPVVNAQGIYQFWGATPYGAANDEGILFSTRSDGTGITTRHTFEIKNLGGNSNDGFTAYGGKLYKLCRMDGLNERGFVMEYDPVTNTTKNVSNLSALNGRDAVEKLTLAGNKLYGILGSFSYFDSPAQLIEFDPVTKTAVSRYTFPEADGGTSMSELVLYNGMLWGISENGGNNGNGHIYAFNPATGIMSKRYSFNYDQDLSFTGKMTLCNNMLYAAGKFMLEYNPNTNNMVKKFNFQDVFGMDGNSASITVYNNKLYGGITEAFSFPSVGALYEYDPATNIATKKADLATAGGTGIFSPMTVYNGKIYGGSGGGSFGGGILFEYNPATSTITRRTNFGLGLGENPEPQFTLLNGKLYGNTSDGGAYNNGTLFEFDLTTNATTKKLDYGGGSYRPTGRVVYYLGKLYGMAMLGGNEASGVIYSFDLVTQTYAVRHHFTKGEYIFNQNCGMIVYNNRLYGTHGINYGNTIGQLFEFNPNNDEFIVRHNFTEATGTRPSAPPTVYNGKLYGTAESGGNSGDGVIYEYDPATTNYAVKVHLGNSFGGNPQSQLVAYNNKLYGITNSAGANDWGTLFEYTPQGNGFQVRYHFSAESGRGSNSTLVLYNNRLYGITSVGGPTGAFGTVFSYDPVSFGYVNHLSLTWPNYGQGQNSFTLFNNKLYGLTRMGGPGGQDGGSLFEYNPASNTVSPKTHFTGMNGRSPRGVQLQTLPALVAPGTPGTCNDIKPVNITAANANEWIPFTDDAGNAIAEINANGNILGEVSVSLYTHDGTTRKDDAGRFYLNRNLTITPEVQPATPVSVRIYILKSEFELLKATPGSGINNHTDITIFKNDDACGKGVKVIALPISSTAAFWGVNDYVYSLQVSSFSSFYLASKAYTALPIKMEYFRGQAKTDHNLLQWKASCTNDVDFTVERSADGINYSSIGVVWAQQADCNNPFQFKDEKPLAGKAWYRLQMKEPDAAPEYSSIIEVGRVAPGSLMVKILPNPVTGSQLVMQISAPARDQMRLFITDMNGRHLIQQTLTVQKGEQQITSNIAQLPAGIYQLVLQSNSNKQIVRFIKH